MAHSEEVVAKVVALKKAGLRSRNIALQLFGNSSSKSTVNSIYNRYLAGLEDKEEVPLEEHQCVFVKDNEDYISEETLEVLCKSEDFDLASLAKRLRTAQKSLARERKISRGVFDSENPLDIVKAIKDVTKELSLPYTVYPNVVKTTGYEKTTMEVLFSDLQVGKVANNYNSKIAEQAVKEYGEQVMLEIYKRKDTIDLEKIIFASIGDSTEDHRKHGVSSAMGVDAGNAEQVALAIKWVWSYLINPLGALKIPMEVVVVSGNHGSSLNKGYDTFKAGLFNVDYTIFTAIEGYCEVAGYDHITFNIPEGTMTTSEIYGRSVLYEHGVGVKATEVAMDTHKRKRGNQMKKYIEYYRQGHCHHVCTYDTGSNICNGAFFGYDEEALEFSSQLGYSSVPAQVVVFHQPENIEGRNTVKEILSIQLAQRK